MPAHHSEPTRYRDVISDATGADPRRMRLFAASPRPTDAALNGIYCRAVIAVSNPPLATQSSFWHSVLVDCRTLQDGWLVLTLPGGILDANELVTVLNDSAPLGWSAHIDIVPDSTGCTYLPPGHVITASYTEQPQHFPDARSAPGTEGEGPVQHAASGTNGDPEHPSSPPSSHTDADELNQAQVAGADVTVITCYLFAPEFIPIEVQVPTPLPASQDDFLALVRASRSDEDWPFFPHLRAVLPQPETTYVCLLALPPWPTIGVPVLLQLLSDAPRTFAIYVPPQLSHTAALNIAGVEAQWGYRVYLRDLPWPIPETGTQPVEPGDLITIALPHQYTLGLALDAMLQWTYGWFVPEGPPGHWPGGT